MQQNACWVFETVQRISITIIKSLICFTEKVYGSSPYSPTHYIYIFFSLKFLILLVCGWSVGWSIELEALPYDHIDS